MHYNSYTAEVSVPSSGQQLFLFLSHQPCCASAPMRYYSNAIHTKQARLSYHCLLRMHWLHIRVVAEES